MTKDPYEGIHLSDPLNALILLYNALKDHAGYMHTCGHAFAPHDCTCCRLQFITSYVHLVLENQAEDPEEIVFGDGIAVKRDKVKIARFEDLYNLLDRLLTAVEEKEDGLQDLAFDIRESQEAIMEQMPTFTGT